jgi:hypothetical protein
LTSKLRHTILLLIFLRASVVQTHGQASKWKGMGVSAGACLPPTEAEAVCPDSRRGETVAPVARAGLWISNFIFDHTEYGFVSCQVSRRQLSYPHCTEPIDDSTRDFLKKPQTKQSKKVFREVALAGRNPAYAASTVRAEPVYLQNG